MSENLRILCVHQGAELYGSDRIFLQSVEAIRKAWPEAHIKVILAADGPLNALLKETADEVLVRPVGVLRLANPFVTLLKMTVGLPYFAGKAALDIAAADVAYINTTVIADFQIAARFFPGVPLTREMGEHEALYSNRKIREMLGFKEEHDWRKYVK